MHIKEETEVDIAELYISSLDVGWSFNGKHPSNLEPLLNRLMQLRFTMTLIFMWMVSQWKASLQLRTSIKSAHATRFHHPCGGMIIPQMYMSMNIEMLVQNHREYHHHFKAMLMQI
ncbi:hypothetical protein ACHQM5_020408 [Ranunculus cassubicifolius]